MRRLLKYLFRWYYLSSTRKAYDRFFSRCNERIKCYDTKKALPKKIETEWLDRFREIDSKASVKSLRIFSHYVADYKSILPYETYQMFIGPVLNLERFMSFYQDKNNLDIFLPKGFVSETVFRRIDGVYKDKDYATIFNISLDYVLRLLDDYTVLIIKPSCDSFGGNSVMKLTKIKGEWLVGGEKLTMDFFDNFGDNFIVQDYLKQSAYISRFCSSSVNTLRVVTYRSVRTNKVSILSIVLRIGNQGSSTDNMSTGGKAVRIDKDGSFANELFDYYGNISKEINGVDFTETKYTLPNYKMVCDFAVDVAKYYPHHHLLAMDIAMDIDNKPKLLEVNINGFSLDIPYFAHFDMFGDMTDEVLDYVKSHKNPHLINIMI